MGLLSNANGILGNLAEDTAEIVDNDVLGENGLVISAAQRAAELAEQLDGDDEVVEEVGLLGMVADLPRIADIVDEII
ncbi:hypothetical protein [Ahrensia kielensis]|uniref:Uncharacterized protein n=1 Tax=Ahrensia kielensis TaxID=76980 RepID=A0ABU9TA97_9HYPH|nr:hypothetical protein [Ahrensia kielensis]